MLSLARFFCLFSSNYHAPTHTSYTSCSSTVALAPPCTPAPTPLHTCSFNPSPLLDVLQTVVAAGTIMCPSCLHSADVGAPTANDCFTPRQDKLVCCSSLIDWNDDSRTCHDPAATVDVAYPAYTTCESACRRAGAPYNEGDYYDECKDPTTGEQKAAMKDVAPNTDAAANKKTWCTCMDACLTCTSGAGGIGARPTGLTNVNSDFAAIHGTCVPPPASWETSTNGDTAQKPPTATNFICAAADPAGNRPFWFFSSTCRPMMLVLVRREI